MKLLTTVPLFGLLILCACDSVALPPEKIRSLIDGCEKNALQPVVIHASKCTGKVIEVYCIPVSDAYRFPCP